LPMSRCLPLQTGPRETVFCPSFTSLANANGASEPTRYPPPPMSSPWVEARALSSYGCARTFQHGNGGMSMQRTGAIERMRLGARCSDVMA
jgi:hypothetical protein